MAIWQVKLILTDYKDPWIGLHKGGRTGATALGKAMNKKLFGGRATMIVKRLRKGSK